MKFDLTLEINQNMWNSAINKALNEDMNLGGLGHLGTHFDIMNKEFPLDYTIRNGKIFDVRHIKNREITLDDISIDNISPNDFIIFYTGYLEEKGYGTSEYFKNYPELSKELIDFLINIKVSIIGIDTTGIRKPCEHRDIDQYCANSNVFVVENLNNLKTLLSCSQNRAFKVYTFPINIKGLTGLTSRVIAEI